MRSHFVTFALFAACRTAAPTADGVPNARAEGTFLHLRAADVAASSDAAIEHSISRGCAGTCDRVYVSIDASSSADALQRLVEAARQAAPAPQIYLIPAEGKRIELAVADGPCAIEVHVKREGATIRRDGELLPPDPTCSRWDVPVCRGEDDLYDWPRLRSEVGTVKEVCLAFETDTAAELPAIHETLRQPVVRLVRSSGPVVGDVSAEKVTAVMHAAGPELQWCLDGEVDASEAVPMQVKLRLAVHVDGTVTRAEVTQGMRSTEQFESCVVDVAKKLHFGELAGVAVVEVMLAFEPGAQRPRMEPGP